MKHRRRVKHTLPFEERIAQAAAHLRDKARKLPPGIERDELLEKARQADNAVVVNKWLASAGSKPPEPEVFAKMGIAKP